MNRIPVLSIATAVATLFVATGCASKDTSSGDANTAKSQSELVKCEGVNECKGTSECKSATNENGCQGLNDCKGQGWVTIPEEECTDRGGSVLGADTAAAKDALATDVPADTTDTKTASVKCDGINECAGHSDCASDANACKGQNECKGQGYLEVPSEADCLEQGGTVQG